MQNRREFLRTVALGGFALMAKSSLLGAGINSSKVMNPADLIYTHFKSDPIVAGWVKQAYYPSSILNWNNKMTNHFISAKEGEWISPEFKIEPFSYYLVEYTGKGLERGHINIEFFDLNHKLCVTDTCDLLFLESDWGKKKLCFRAFALASYSKIHLISEVDTIEIDEIKVDKVSSDEVALWRTELLNTLPRNTELKVNESGSLPKTKQILNRGGNLRIVMLGDSTINDTGNSLYESEIQEKYPNATVQVVNSIRGSTGCVYYQHENRIEEYVLQYNPDLVIIGGISNEYDEKAIKSVINQIQSKSKPDFLFLRDSITPESILYKRFIRPNKGITKEIGEKIISEYPAKLENMLREEKINYLDMRKYWAGYITNSGKPEAWFLRDDIHANTRGKLVVGEFLLSYILKSIS